MIVGLHQQRGAVVGEGRIDVPVLGQFATELCPRLGIEHSSDAVESGDGDGFASGDLKIDLLRRHVFVGEKEVHLTPIEYKLLTTLVKHAGLVMTHRQLLKEVWGPLHVEESQYLRVYMRQLRHKLEKDPARPRYLLTELGVGYRLNTA